MFVYFFVRIKSKCKVTILREERERERKETRVIKKEREGKFKDMS